MSFFNGQWLQSSCWYPISSKKWSWSFRANIPAAMLWTGASPQRCRKSKGERWDRVESKVPSSEREPHNRTRPWSRGTRRMQYTQGLARNPYLRSQSCSRLRTHILTCEWQRVNRTTYNGICCMSRHHHVRRIPWHCPKRQIPGASWWNLEYLFIITTRRVNYCIPLTCPHKVGMVAVISYTAMVNADGGHYGWLPSKEVYMNLQYTLLWSSMNKNGSWLMSQWNWILGLPEAIKSLENTR
jgi:hypothetical protein